MLLKVWILTIFVFDGGSASYTFKNREECVTASAWYQSTLENRFRKGTCYPSYIPIGK